MQDAGGSPFSHTHSMHPLSKPFFFLTTLDKRTRHRSLPSCHKKPASERM